MTMLTRRCLITGNAEFEGCPMKTVNMAVTACKCKFELEHQWSRRPSLSEGTATFSSDWQTFRIDWQACAER